MKKQRLLFLVTEDWYFYSHRLEMARLAHNSGFEVFVATRVSEYREKIEKEGFTLLPINLIRGSRNPLRELKSFLQIVSIYRKIRPDIVHHVAMKPILYGSWAARFTRVPAVLNAVAGLGYIFLGKGWRSTLFRRLFEKILKITLSPPRYRMIFQNKEDYQKFFTSGIIKPNQATIIRGSGVNAEVFLPTPEPKYPPVVLLPARMLWDKGIKDFAEAAQILKTKGLQARYVLVGREDTQNPTGIPLDQLHSWQSSGLLEWWGHQDNMPKIFQSSHIVVLPSYREGLPKALLEAASCGKPIIATDVPGCREIVSHGHNGLLVPPKSPQDFALAIEKLLTNLSLRTEMGNKGREIVLKNFTSSQIAKQTLDIYRELLEPLPHSHPSLSCN